MDGRPYLFHNLPLSSRLLHQYQIILFGGRHMGANNLPKAKIDNRQRGGLQSNTSPSDCESSVLTTRLPTHPPTYLLTYIIINKIYWEVLACAERSCWRTIYQAWRTSSWHETRSSECTMVPSTTGATRDSSNTTRGSSCPTPPLYPWPASTHPGRLRSSRNLWADTVNL